MSNPAQLYIDLIKKALTFSIWEDTGHPIEVNNHMRAWHKRVPIQLIATILGWFGMEAFMKSNRQNLQDGFAWPRYADSMIGIKRMDNIQFCVEDVLNKNVPGDLIETGVWRGGSCIFMRAILAAYEDTDRTVWVADSFQGLPEPDEEKYPADKGDEHFKLSFLAVSEEQVRNNFERYGLLDDQVKFLKGWFKDTLPSAPIEKIAVMRLDGDMYESTMDALNALYDKLSPGGYCIIDDYALTGCKQAVDEYREKHEITSPVVKVDWTGAYWQKV